MQLVVNTHDKYVRPYGYDDTARWVPRLWRRDIKAGHFSPMSHPQVLAAAVHDFADVTDGNEPSRALLRAQVGRPRGAFGDSSGARSPAPAAASAARRRSRSPREGAELVVSDIDEAAVKDTAAEIVARGGTAYPYVLDVSDGAAVELFAERVSAERGCRTSSSTTPASVRPGTSWTPRPSSSTACWTSTSAAW